MTSPDHAAALWGATVSRLIVERENAVYEIALPGGGRAALRLHRAGYQDAAAIRSELWWCAELAARGVAVPAALPARDGALLQVLPSGRLASVIDWVEGAPIGLAGVPLTGGLPEQAAVHRDLGRLLARMHNATDQLTLPQGFVRPRWDIDGLVGEAPLWGRFWEHAEASPDQRAILRAARHWLRDRLLAYASDADVGLIHADVLRENILSSADGLVLIDFDDSGFGFRPYDLGTALSQNLYEPFYPQIRAALIEGYAELRGIDASVVDAFTLARTLASVGWAMPRLAPGHPVHASHLARAVKCAQMVMDQTTT